MSVKLIVAVDNGNAIGWADGRLPWKIPYDMKQFKEKTTGHTVVMGMNTWKSLNLPSGLPNRKNIVLTRKPYSEVREFFSPSANIDIISSLDYVDQLNKRQHDVIWIIGGASVYAGAIERQLVDELHVTFVNTTSGADVSLPFDLSAWKLFIIKQRKLGVNWEVIDHRWPVVVEPSPGIYIVVFRKIK